MQDFPHRADIPGEPIEDACSLHCRSIFPCRCLRQHDPLTIGELHHLLILRLRQHGLSPARPRKGARATGWGATQVPSDPPINRRLSVVRELPAPFWPFTAVTS